MDAKKSGIITMVIGVFVLILGVVATYISYSSYKDIGSQGYYIIFWGMIVSGLYTFFRGLDKFWYK